MGATTDMRRRPISFTLLFRLFAACLSTCTMAHAEERLLSFGNMGELHLYQKSADAPHVVLLLSDSDGWTQAMSASARQLAELDALVVGIDSQRYLQALQSHGDPCLYPAGEFESMSHFVQKSLARTRYTPPVVAGMGEGATLAYALLAQAPAGTFSGGISQDFCPELETTAPLCPANKLQSKPVRNGFRLQAAALSAPWTVLRGDGDRCGLDSVRAFVAASPSASLVVSAPARRGASTTQRGQPLLAAFRRLTQDDTAPAAPQSIGDLPVVEVGRGKDMGDTLVVMVSGDGGWAGIDRELGAHLRDAGLAVVGLNSLQYFWQARDPDQAGHALEHLLRYYLHTWRKQHVVLIGYSLGADVLPFMATRLPADLRARVALVALLAPGRTASFEFHVSDWVGGRDKNALSTQPEVERLHLPVLCLYGEEEADSLCPTLGAGTAQRVKLKGGHHFDNDYRRLAEEILAAARR